MTQAEVARKGRIAVSEVCHWERGQREIPNTQRALGALSRALEIPQAPLFEYLNNDIFLHELPLTLAQKKQALPQAWVEPLYALLEINADINSITNVLSKLHDKLSVKG